MKEEVVSSRSPSVAPTLSAVPTVSAEPSSSPTTSVNPTASPAPTRSCEDYPNWTDFAQHDCAFFESNLVEGCPNAGNIVGVYYGSFTGQFNSDGLSGNEACCYCGGGNNRH